jgi:flagellar motor switch protein FliG
VADALNGNQKAAVLLALIGEEAAANVLKHLEPDEVRRITMEVAKLKMIDPSRHEGILDEFVGLIKQSRGLELAGPPLAKRLLARTRPEEVDQILSEIEPRKVRDQDEEAGDARAPELPEAVVAAPARRLTMLLQEEPAQTVALVLAHLPPKKAARVMRTFEPKRRTEVTRRMASMSEVRPDVVARVGAVLEQNLQALCEEPMVAVDGLTTTADRLTSLGRAEGQELLDSLQDEFPELASKLRDVLFTWEMLRGLDNRGVQEVLKEVDRATLAMSLKGAELEMQQLFLGGMSERAAQMLNEEMEFLGAPKLSEIEAAQRQMVELVLKLEKEGRLTLEEAAVAAG